MRQPCTVYLLNRPAAKGFISGAGGLVLDQKKSRAIRHWLEATSSKAWTLVEQSQHDLPFNMGAYGETFAGNAAMFLKSTANGLAASDFDWQPLKDESFVTIDWQLPLSEHAQYLLFQRILSDFNKATQLVDHASKKKYRKRDDDLLHCRHRCALWDQVRTHIATRTGTSIEDKEKKLATTSFMDFDLDELLKRRPRSFALSMLELEKEKAQQELQEMDEKACLEVESQRLQVRTARWQFFQKALAQDHISLQQVQAAPDKLATMLHKKEVQWRKRQSDVGAKAVDAYMERYLRVVRADNAEVIKSPVMEYLTYVETRLIW